MTNYYNPFDKDMNNTYCNIWHHYNPYSLLTHAQVIIFRQKFGYTDYQIKMFCIYFNWTIAKLLEFRDNLIAKYTEQRNEESYKQCLHVINVILSIKKSYSHIFSNLTNKYIIDLYINNATHFKIDF